MPDDAPKYTIRDDYDPDDEMPTDTDPVEAYQTYVDDNGDMGFTLEDFERYIAEMRRRRKRRLPKEQGYRLFQTVVPTSSPRLVIKGDGPLSPMALLPPNPPWECVKPRAA
jgi:hypothetical protein